MSDSTPCQARLRLASAEQIRGWSSGVVPSIAGNERMYPITDKVQEAELTLLGH